MSQSAARIVEDQTVVASLQPGPNGTVRLSFEYPEAVLEGFSLGNFAEQGQMARVYASPVIEIDRDQLKQLQFSQEELAEIGFSLVARLSALVRY
jgi:hypothetical protein